MSPEFSQSPLFIIEKAVARFTRGGMDSGYLLELVDQQYQRVQEWLGELTTFEAAQVERGEELKALGLNGNHLMLEALEILYESSEEKDLIGLEEGTELLRAGHRMVVESFAICDALEHDAEDELERSGLSIVA